MAVDEEYLTPPELAKLWGVNLRKVMHFIETGELPAINLALDPKGARPRYRIRLFYLQAFEAGRTTVQSVIRRPQRPRRPARDPRRVNRYPE